VGRFRGRRWGDLAVPWQRFVTFWAEAADGL